MRFLFGVLMLVSWCALAQGPDSLPQSDSLQNSDSTSLAESIIPSAFERKPDDTAEADTSVVEVRSFDKKRLEELKADPDLQYATEKTVGASIWTRFWRLIGDWLEALFDGATTTNWGRLFAYIFLLAGLVVVILMILKVNAFRVFYGDGASPIGHRSIDENIHEMDFERLIQDAIGKQDYRLSVRLVFLYALKMLADKNHIHWMQGKTNQDYLNELKAGELKKGFSELNYFFEYAWYGNFAITDGLYARVKQTFDHWRTTI